MTLTRAIELGVRSDFVIRRYYDPTTAQFIKIRAALHTAVYLSLAVVLCAASTSRSYPTTSLQTASGGTLWVWGGGTYGSLGLGKAGLRGVISPTLLDSLSCVTSVSTTDGGQTFALSANGTVWAWGDNLYGALGAGRFGGFSDVPLQVHGLVHAIAVAGSPYDGYALLRNGEVWSWGAGGSGSLGNGSYDNSNVPVRVKGLTDIKAITAGGGTAFAVGADGELWSWGYGLFGQLGDGSERDSNIPVRVRSIGNVSAMSMGDSEALALLRNGTVWWWGVQVDTGVTRDTPREERSLRGFVGVSQGGEAAYAWNATGTVWAWGDGEMGELGNGTYRDSPTPVEVTSIHAVAVSGGQGWALTRGSSGTVWMWGASPVDHETARPVVVQGLQHVIAVAAGGDDGFAIVEPAGSH